MTGDRQSGLPPKALPMRYRTIVADPPWDMPTGGPRTSGDSHWPARPSGRRVPYPTMALDDIARIPVSEWADEAAHLYIWTVNAYIAETYEIAGAWGFRPAQMLTWCKAPRGLGLGGAFTSTTEHVLFCRRGVLPAQQRTDTTWWQWKRGAHSAKPEAFLDIVEQVSPGPYLEMFSRRARLGWDVWGNESLAGGEAVVNGA